MAWVSEIGSVADAVPHGAAERRCCADLWGLAEVPGDGGMTHIAAHGADEKYLAHLRRDGARRCRIWAARGRGAIAAPVATGR